MLWIRPRFDVFGASLVLVAVTGLTLGGCGGAPKPERGVLESNFDTWRFRRYQKLLDVEVWVPRNSAVGHTATYVRKDAERAGQLDVGDLANVFVTRYERDRGILRALLSFAQRLSEDGGYEVEMRSLGGADVISVVGQGESWVLWQAEYHVLKIGGRGLDIAPEELVEAYAARYPSLLDNETLDRPLPPAEDDTSEEEAGGPAYDSDNPSPDWQEYQPESDDASSDNPE